MHSRYDHPLIRKIWEDQQRYLYWVEIETTFLRNLKGKSAIINSIESSDILRIRELEQITKHDIGAFIQWLEEKLTPLIGSDARFVHYGLTSSDIVDTAFSMAIRDSNIIIEKLLEKLVNIIHELAVRYKFNTIVGRTHGQHAEVFPLRQKFMSYHNVLLAFPEQKYYGRLAGSVGNYAYFQPEIAEKTIKSLGLIPSIFNDGQVIHRSVYARYMNEWAVLASVLAKIATDIRLLAQTEVGEFQEDFSDGQVGSSSMPHKRNPVLSENICGLARVIRGYQTTAMQDVELWNERDISHSSAERMIFPSAAVTLGFMLTRMIEIFSNLQINEIAIAKKVNDSCQLSDSQSKMLKLIDSGMTRAEAHKKIKEISHNEVHSS